jgi:hypothetical protein
MNHAGGEIDLPGVFRGKRIAMHEFGTADFPRVPVERLP